MLRVGLTGGLGSGKSTVAAYLRSLGAEVIEADALGRQMMEPGQPVFDQIVREFGREVLSPDGRLNRAQLAQLAFQGGRIHQLNAIVHPAVIEAQRRWMEGVFARNASAVAVVESALIFEVVRDAQARGEQEGVLADWRRRIDRVILVTATDELKIARYVARLALACPLAKPLKPMPASASPTRSQMPKKPPVPTMSLIILAIRRLSVSRSPVFGRACKLRATILPISCL